MKRRRFLGLTTVLALIPWTKQFDGIKAAPLATRSFDDEEPFGLQPPHQKCTKWEKPEKPEKDVD